LGKSALNEWTLADIEQNDIKVCQQIKSVFAKWIAEYEPKVDESNQAPEPTPEELAMIKMLRDRGLI
jgi:hypothetical protein